MMAYWALFLFPAVFALREGGVLAGKNGRWMEQKKGKGPLLLAIPLLTFIVGWRYEVGGDWGNYERQFAAAYYSGIADALTASEPGYELLQWLAIEADWGIYGVNFVAGALFSIGLVLFCRSLPRPWLGLVVAIPYLVVVVAMGYTRQGLALGLCMLGLVALQRQQVVRFVLWVALAASFHSSAVLVLPVAVLASTRKRAITGIVLGIGVLLAYGVAFQESMDAYAGVYLDSGMASEGALIRLAMNLLPAFIVLRWGERLSMTEHQRQLWKWFSIISVALFVAYFLISASTALDRIALYMLPLQLVVLSHLPDMRKRSGASGGTSAKALAVVGYCAAVQFVWLNFATHSYMWVPYRFFPIEAWT